MSLLAQDIHFSQFDKNPLYLNPASTGVMAGDCRAILNYRSQWGSISVPFITPSISYEKKKYLGEDYLGLGFHLLTDQSGTDRYRHSALSLSLSYMNVFKQTHLLSIGAQVTGAYDYIKYDLTFDQSYDDAIGDFNPTINSGEVANNQLPSVFYPDVHAGLLLANMSDDWAYHLGFAVHHIIRPNNNFLDRVNNFGIDYKYTVHGDIKKKLGKLLFVQPKLLFSKQAGSQEILMGGNVGLQSEQAGFHLGMYVRRTSSTSDAIVPLGGITYGQFEFNLSYDVNISNLVQASNALGGYELSLIFNCASSKIYKVAIPCRRY